MRARRRGKPVASPSALGMDRVDGCTTSYPPLPRALNVRLYIGMSAHPDSGMSAGCETRAMNMGARAITHTRTSSRGTVRLSESRPTHSSGTSGDSEVTYCFKMGNRGRSDSGTCGLNGVGLMKARNGNLQRISCPSETSYVQTPWHAGGKSSSTASFGRSVNGAETGQRERALLYLFAPSPDHAADPRVSEYVCSGESGRADRRGGTQR